ncbi:hydroxyethylthiazole kinase [Gracilibacillus halophilus YIM-C55.5]|uniref:Hydroxyethylthiazole kinase n=1 Tax=Gracilibacillus halophilus YIM-C55.5 TaxID=1308866 RepID=N4WJX5_9BACI|nr:hydroxyethylthiazole kinase [Gracilibacillus halophilus]ENH96472.1 hydroxyethylthiazole kinase [Gracilibacillus halophilus YIM-C55.5]
MIESVRKKQPLVHHITNQVVMNFTANGLYALGAAPVMAHAKEEVEEMATVANALVLNIGTLTAEQIEAMIIAGKAANRAGTPIVLDPVGVGATSFRTESARRILDEVDIQMIRGNAGEVASLAGITMDVKGVDGAEGVDGVALASKAYEILNVPLAITGETDVLIDDHEKMTISNGDAMLTKVTGSGCLLSSVIASFLAVEQTLFSAANAVGFYGIAAERATEQARHPGQFQIALLDQLHQVSGQDVEKHIRLSKQFIGQGDHV